jgi:hypothetical protein
VGSRQLYVFNTHLQASHSSASFSSAVPSRGGMGYRQLRQQQLAKIRQFVTEAARHSGVPWLLAGDFNIDAIADQVPPPSGQTQAVTLTLTF